jgi:hypothetical protein
MALAYSLLCDPSPVKYTTATGFSGAVLFCGNDMYRPVELPVAAEACMLSAVHTSIIQIAEYKTVRSGIVSIVVWVFLKLSLAHRYCKKVNTG